MLTFGRLLISTGFTTSIDLTKENVSSYEVVDETTRKSTGSAIGRGLVGSLLLGPVGLVAGAATAKSKGTHTVAIEFKSGERSLLEVDDKIYKALVRCLF